MRILLACFPVSTWVNLIGTCKVENAELEQQATDVYYTRTKWMTNIANLSQCLVGRYTNYTCFLPPLNNNFISWSQYPGLFEHRGRTRCQSRGQRGWWRERRKIVPRIDHGHSPVTFHHSPNHSPAKTYLFKNIERAPVSENVFRSHTGRLFPSN